MPGNRQRTSDWRGSEQLAKRWIEDHGFDVHDANIVFRTNCPNIDLIVYGKHRAIYVQTKSSEIPAGKDCVVIDGSPWSKEQLYNGAPIFNKIDHFQAAFVIIVDKNKDGGVQFYVAPPGDLEPLVRARGVEWAEKPKRNGDPRSIGFRKELPREALSQWRDAWHLFGERPSQP